MPAGPDGWFDAAPPIRVEGGLKARSKRGSIGERWWSRRFVDILEGVCDPGRLSRGRAYARKGQVLEMDLEPGRVSATVQGSRPRPYAVRIDIAVFGPRVWDAVRQELAGRAVYRARLLAGEMPPEIEAVFAETGHPLFPATLDMSCSCPDPGLPCKHLSAVLYLLGEAFDDDPFLVLAWRGRGRDELLDSVRTAVAAEREPPIADVALADAVDGFFTPGVSLGRLRTRRPAVDGPADLLLRAVPPPKLKVRHLPLIDILRPAYHRLGSQPDGKESP